MSWQLMNFVDPIIHPIVDIQGQLAQFTALHRDAHNRLLGQATSLTAAGGLDLFAGSGAIAYTDAVEQYIAVSERHMQILDQATRSANSFINGIMGAVANASTAFLDEELVSHILDQLTPDDVIQRGGESVMSIIHDMVNTIGNMASSGGGFLGNLVTLNFGGMVNDAGQMIHDTGQLVGDAWKLLGDIPRVLTQWAEDIYNTVKSWGIAIEQYIAALFFYVPHVTKGTPTNEETSASIAFNKDPNMEMLAQKISAQENANTKIGIEMVGPNTILVTLAGTNIEHPGLDTNLPNALDAGGGDKNNPYLQDINAAIEQYIQEHHLPPGTQVIVAGHSLGGIEAEYLAENNGTTNYTVSQVITFGSPQIGPPVQGVQYHQYFNQYDPITLTSWYELKPFYQVGGLPGTAGAIYALNTGNPKIKAAFLNETLIRGNPNNMPSNPSPSQWLNDHNYSNGKTNWYLQNQHFTVNGTKVGSIPNGGNSMNPVGQTEFYQGTPQNNAADWTRTTLQIGSDMLTADLPSIPDIPFLNTHLNSCLLMPVSCLP